MQCLGFSISLAFIKNIFLTLEEEFRTSARPCNILYISLQIDLIMVTRLIFLIVFDIFCMLSLLSLLSMFMLIYKAFFNFQFLLALLTVPCSVSNKIKP